MINKEILSSVFFHISITFGINFLHRTLMTEIHVHFRPLLISIIRFVFHSYKKKIAAIFQVSNLIYYNIKEIFFPECFIYDLLPHMLVVTNCFVTSSFVLSAALIQFLLSSEIYQSKWAKVNAVYHFCFVLLFKNIMYTLKRVFKFWSK